MKKRKSDFFKLFYFYNFWRFICSVCMSVYHMWWSIQQKVSDSLELELQTIVSRYVGAGNPTLVLWKISLCS